MAAQATTPPLPRRFGRYALFDYIGKGGMAEIYLARARTDLGAHRLCVVKQILPELAQQPRFAEMLIHEAKLAARLNHANVVQVFDLGRGDEDRLYIAMDYVEGFDLNDLLRRCSRTRVPLPFEFACLCVCDALRGLDYAHRRMDDDGKPLGIVHRDVSPSNVLVSFEGEIKLCDFGIARANDAVDGASINDDAIKGKAGYMSPEQALGVPVDARSDVFAAGIVLWELVAGRRMYRSDPSLPPLIEQARAARIPELPTRRLPREDDLRAIVHRALEAEPTSRYATAQAMLRDLEDYMADAKLVASHIRFGEWLVDHFGGDIVAQRRSRERAAEALERGAPVLLTPIPPAMPEREPSPVPAARHRQGATSEGPLPASGQAAISPKVIANPAYAAAIDRPPESIALGALDVSPPSMHGELPSSPPAPAPHKTSPVYYVIAAVAVALAVAVVVLLLALR